MGQGYAESIPQTTLEKMLGGVGAVSRGAQDWLNEKVYHKSGMGLGDVLLNAPTTLLEDMSWGQSLLKPGGHGPNLDDRITEMPGFGTATKLSKMAALPMAGYIFGKKAKGADLNKLNRAEVMRSGGKGEDEIFAETGWWLGHPDKQPRWEKSHDKEVFIPATDIARHNNISTLDPDMHDEVFDVAPALTDRLRRSPIHSNYDTGGIQAWSDEGSGTGSYLGDGKTGLISIAEGGIGNPDKPSDIKKILQHEVQHFAGGVEGFSPGGNVTEMRDVLRNQAMARVVELEQKQMRVGKKYWTKIDELNMKNAKKDVDRFTKGSENLSGGLESLNSYMDLADESQARLVESRAHMTQPQMDADPFWKNYDRKLDHMILKDRNTGKIQNRSLLDNYLSKKVAK